MNITPSSASIAGYAISNQASYLPSVAKQGDGWIRIQYGSFCSAHEMYCNCMLFILHCKHDCCCICVLGVESRARCDRCLVAHTICYGLYDQ